MYGIIRKPVESGAEGDRGVGVGQGRVSHGACASECGTRVCCQREAHTFLMHLGYISGRDCLPTIPTAAHRLRAPSGMVKGPHLWPIRF